MLHDAKNNRLEIIINAFIKNSFFGCLYIIKERPKKLLVNLLQTDKSLFLK